MPRGDATQNGSRHSASHGKSEHRQRKIGSQRTQKRECGNGVFFALPPTDGSGAFSVAGVVKNQRGHAVLCQKRLHAEPIRDGFSDSMTNEQGGAGEFCRRPNENSIEGFIAAGEDGSRNRKSRIAPGKILCGSPQQLVAENQRPADDRDRGGEGKPVKRARVKRI